MAARRPEPPERRDAKRDLRAIVLTLASLGLSIGVLASISNRTAAAGEASPKDPTSSTSSTTSTTSPSLGGPATTTTSTTPASPGRVVVLAPAGSPATAGVQQKLTAAHYSLVGHAPIPSSWVTNLTQPIVRYPNGLYDEAVNVAKALGVQAVSAEPPGTSDGADVVEVFVPAS